MEKFADLLANMCSKMENMEERMNGMYSMMENMKPLAEKPSQENTEEETKENTAEAEAEVKETEAVENTQETAPDFEALADMVVAKLTKQNAEKPEGGEKFDSLAQQLSQRWS